MKSDEADTERVCHEPGEIRRGQRAKTNMGGGVVADRRKIFSLTKSADEITTNKSHSYTRTRNFSFSSNSPLRNDLVIIAISSDFSFNLILKVLIC